MAKNRRRTQPYVYLVAGIGLVVIVVLVLLASRGTSTTADAVQSISPADYQTEYVNASVPHLLLDVRTPEEFASGHIQGAVNISVETLRQRLNEVPREQPIIVYCRSGNRSAQAASILAQANYTDIHDLGGINAWVAQGYPVE